MLDHMLWLALSIVWLAVSILSLIGIWINPQFRIRYAARDNVNFRIAFVIVAVASSYIWHHDPRSIYIWLASLPFIFATSYIARRHRRLVMNCR